jgi:FAD:protein FMN transferase
MLMLEERHDTPRHRFKAMGTRVELISAPGTDPHHMEFAAGRVARLFADQDARFSRFRPESELCRVNERAGGWVTVSRPFASLTRVALQAAEETDGLFDPTVLPALRAAGYDRDFAEVRARYAGRDTIDEEVLAIRRDFRDLVIKDAITCGAWRDVELRGDRLRLPEGAELDFGGIAKGWTVDLAAEALPPLPWAIVDAGGDLRIAGDPPEGGIDIAIEDPQTTGAEALRLRLGAGALATSSVTVRSWGMGAHHVIDPRTSLPALTGVLQATVWAETCTKAEIWSKAALLEGPAVLDRVAGTLVMGSGEIVTSFGAANDEWKRTEKVIA